MNKEKYLKTFGQNIRYYRQRLGLSQEELAEKVGYTTESRKTTISKIENGKMDIPASKISAFAKAFGISPVDLLDEHPEAIVCDYLEQCYGQEAYQMVTTFLRLNRKGQIEAIKRVEELTFIPMYTDNLMPIAAHALKPYDPDDPDHAADDALMQNDEVWK